MGNRVALSPGFCCFLALMILLVPLPWIVAMVMAAAWHECCHFAMIRVFSSSKPTLRLGFLGASTPLPPMGRGKEVLCALAGPVGSLLLWLLIGIFPRLALCGLAQGICNLMPLYPLDGGRVVRGLLSLALPPNMARKLGDCVEWGSMATVATLGCYGSFVLKLGLLPLCIAAMLLFHGIFGKIPCKAAHLRVQ